jgi:hypothetical protein
MASSCLAAVNSNGVRREGIDRVERFRQKHEDPTTDDRRPILVRIYMVIDQRGADYAIECMRILLQREISAQ